MLEEATEVAKEMGFQQVSLSSDVMQMVKMVSRGFTATADAYLTPHIVKSAPDLVVPSQYLPPACACGWSVLLLA